MHCMGMNFTDFLLHCKCLILKDSFFAAHAVSRETRCPPPPAKKTTRFNCPLKQTENFEYTNKFRLIFTKFCQIF